MALTGFAPVASAQETPRVFPETYRSPVDPSPTAQAARSQPEKDCAEAVPGRVAWNQANYRDWMPGNVQRLCEGTRRPAIRIECFKRQVAQHDDWLLGIMACKLAEERLGTGDPPEKALAGYLPPLSEQEKQCHLALQGQAVHDRSGATRWPESSLRKVCQGTPNGQWTSNCVKARVARGLSGFEATGICNTAGQAALGVTVPDPQPPKNLTASVCREIVTCLLDTGRSFSPADLCDSCDSGPVSAIAKVSEAINAPSVAAACGAANEVKWLKDTITGGPIAALNLGLCAVGKRSSDSLNQYCDRGGNCVSNCVASFGVGQITRRQLRGCNLSCGCGVDELICESGTATLAGAMCTRLGLRE